MKPNEINKLLKDYEIKIYSYKKKKDCYIVTTNKGRFVVSNNFNNNYIFDYLSTRMFNFYPEIIINDKYLVTKYIEDKIIPKEQKINDLTDLMSLLHSKTSYYKNITDEYLIMYDELKNNYNYLYEYYQNIINDIDNSIFLSPSKYLFARNITLILDSLNLGRYYLETWKEKISKLDKMRVSVINNDLSLSNYKRDDKPYIINWSKSKIDIPIFDLYKLNSNEDIDIYEVLKRYEKKYQLKNGEKELLMVLLFMPNKIDVTGNEYNICKNIKREINRLIKVHKLNKKYEKVNLND